MTTDQSVDQWADELRGKLANIDFTPCFPKIREVVLNSIAVNFKSGGRYGNENQFGGGSSKWKISGRARKQAGQTLVDTGRLASSVRCAITQSGSKINIEIGSNLKYAAVHQFGYEFDVAARSSLIAVKRYSRGTKKGKFRKLKKAERSQIGQGMSFRAHKRTVAARPYLVLQNQDITDICNILAEFVVKMLSR